MEPWRSTASSILASCSLVYISAKNYPNRFMHTELIASQRCDVFETQRRNVYMLVYLGQGLLYS